MKRLFIFLACLVTLSACGQGVFANWNRFNPVHVLGACENPYSLPTGDIFTNLVWHLDAALNITNASGTAPANGDAIQVWKDGVTGQTFTQLNPASRPVFNSTGTNSHPSVTFDGNNPGPAPSDFLTNYSGTTYAQGNTAFFVCQAVIPVGSFGAEIIDSGSSGRALMQIDTSTARLQIFGGTLLQGSPIASGAGTTAWFVWTGQWNGGSTLMRTNGVSYASGAGGSASFVGFTLGCANGAFVNSGWNGEIAEALFYNATLTASDMTAVENYLKGKYCIP